MLVRAVGGDEEVEGGQEKAVEAPCNRVDK